MEASDTPTARPKFLWVAKRLEARPVSLGPTELNTAELLGVEYSPAPAPTATKMSQITQSGVWRPITTKSASANIKSPNPMRPGASTPE